MFTASQLKAYLGITTQAAGEDTILTDIEARAVALIERATGRYFGASASVTWTLSGGGGVALYLPDDVTAVASVSYRGAVHEDYTAMTVTDDFVLDGTRKLYRVDGSYWPDGDALVTVTATRGYAAGDEPGPIRQLVLDLVNFQFRAGRKFFLEDGGTPDVSQVPGWDRTINLYRMPLYG